MWPISFSAVLKLLIHYNNLYYHGIFLTDLTTQGNRYEHPKFCIAQAIFVVSLGC